MKNEGRIRAKLLAGPLPHPPHPFLVARRGERLNIHGIPSPIPGLPEPSPSLGHLRENVLSLAAIKIPVVPGL